LGFQSVSVVRGCGDSQVWVYGIGFWLWFPVWGCERSVPTDGLGSECSNVGFKIWEPGRSGLRAYVLGFDVEGSRVRIQD
jgi:hypothetical protein